MVFQAMLFGGELAERRFPAMTEPAQGGEDCSGFLGDFGCGIRNVMTFIVNVFKTIWGVVLLIFDLSTFNVPGAPWFIRVVVGGIVSGAVVWSIATLIRGN